jgi:ribosomal protein S18 acetylase RimI-like enzyme
MIARLGKEHVKEVARLHRANLTGLLSRLGLPAIRAFYAGAVKTSLGVGFVYIEGNLVRGFVLGSIHPGSLKHAALQKNPFDTLAGMCLGILRRPSTLIFLLKSFRGPDEGAYDRDAPELTYIAVSGEKRGVGIGAELVNAFTNEMRNFGIGAYELSVDDDNGAAISFYEGLGFVLSGRYREFGISHRRYRLDIGSRNS